MKFSAFVNNIGWILLLTSISSGKSMADFVDDLLHPDVYDNGVRPGTGSGQPVKVLVDMFLNSISSINEVNMEYTINIFLRQRWIDERLSYSEPDEDITLNYNLFDRLWVPDLFIKNEKSATFHKITVPNRLLILSPNGQVYYSQRLSLTLNCGMNLRYYPMDNQTCKIEMESYGYTTRDIIFEWREGNPIQKNEELQLPEFILTDTDTGDCTAGYITGAFTCLYVQIALQRQFEYYLVQTFVPSSLIVALSWVSFWIDIHAVPARITLGLLTVLTMTTQSSGISSRLPRVSYIKAIDIWMTACLVFVFGGLIEYSIVNVLIRKEQKMHNQEEAKNTDVNSSAEGIPRMLKEETNETPMTSEVLDDSVTGNRVTVDVNSICLQQVDSSGSESPKLQPCNGVTRNRKAPHGADESTSTADILKIYGISEKKPTLFVRMKKNPALALDMVSRILFPSAFVVFNIVYWTIFKVNNLAYPKETATE